MKIVRDVKKARATLLKRTPPETQEGPPWLRKRIEGAFGRPMSLQEVVEYILSEVRARGDQALLEFEWRLDGVKINSLEVTGKEMTKARSRVDRELASALELASDRIRAFHLNCRRESWMDFGEGGLGQWIRPLDRVGVYVPGGKASYPSTLLMTAIPARVAGVKEIIVTSPPGTDGEISPATLLAAEIARVDRVFKVGGAQAVAAMAFGTKTIPKVDKICGPGNIFVQLAKKMVYGTVGIDGFYGPTETIVVADDTANPACCAADLLAQAEHDAMASAILITPSEKLATAVNLEVDKQVARLGRRSVVGESLKDRGGIVVVPDMDTALSLVNEYAPEHVSLMVNDAWTWAEKVKNAGGVFVGEDSPEVVGDYTAGPSHVMPTGGTAHFSSPVNLDDFLKVTSVVAINRKTLGKIGPAAAAIARAEGLDAHSRAVEVRLAGRRRKKND
ncbi:MAG: histidinol dehydrogenase [Dehalococcoidia bacterium]|nr:histidinol dehydrogenase [Dehalococcoidia bacterium]